MAWLGAWIGPPHKVEVRRTSRRESEPLAAQLHEPVQRQQLNVREVRLVPVLARHRHLADQGQAEKAELGVCERGMHAEVQGLRPYAAAHGMGGFRPFSPSAHSQIAFATSTDKS